MVMMNTEANEDDNSDDDCNGVTTTINDNDKSVVMMMTSMPPAQEEEEHNNNDDDDMGRVYLDGAKLQKRRWCHHHIGGTRFILPLLCATTCIYFIIRQHIWLAAVSIMDDLDMNRKQFGFAMSTYSIAYAVIIVPGSIVAKKIGARTAFAGEERALEECRYT